MSLKYFGVRWVNINKGRSPLEDLGKEYFSSTFLPYALKAVMEFGAIILLSSRFTTRLGTLKK